MCRQCRHLFFWILFQTKKSGVYIVYTVYIVDFPCNCRQKSVDTFVDTFEQVVYIFKSDYLTYEIEILPLWGRSLEASRTTQSGSMPVGAANIQWLQLSRPLFRRIVTVMVSRSGVGNDLHHRRYSLFLTFEKCPRLGSHRRFCGKEKSLFRVKERVRIKNYLSNY